MSTGLRRLLRLHPRVRAQRPLRFDHHFGRSAASDGVFGGTPDGIGAFDNGDGTITVLVNHEFGTTVGLVRDHGSMALTSSHRRRQSDAGGG